MINSLGKTNDFIKNMNLLSKTEDFVKNNNIIHKNIKVVKLEILKAKTWFCDKDLSS